MRFVVAGHWSHLWVRQPLETAITSAKRTEHAMIAWREALYKSTSINQSIKINKQKNKNNYNKLINGLSTRALAILNIKLLSLNKMSVVPHIRISPATPCFSYSVCSCGQSNIIWLIVIFSEQIQVMFLTNFVLQVFNFNL